MAAQLGRGFIVQIETGTPGTYATIAGSKTLKLSGSRGTVDITSKDDDAWQTLLEGAATRKFQVTVDGVFKDDSSHDLVEAAFLSGALTNFKIIRPGTTDKWITATFQVSSLETSGNVDAEITFSATLDSSGEVSIADAS